MRRVVLLVVVLVLGAVGQIAHAMSTLSFQAVGQKVSCDGAVVMSLGPSGASAESMARRLNSLAESGLKVSELRVRKDGRSRVLTARGATLIVITRKMARGYRMTASTLATTWLGNLQRQFRRPYLCADSATVPLGETRLAPVEGNVVGPVRIEVDSGVATGAWDRSERAVRIVGREVGHAMLTIADTKSELRIPVKVAQYAAQLDGPINATVTGSPASLFAIESAVAQAVQSAIHPEPSATCQIFTEMGNVSPPYPGHSVQVTVSISADGPGYLPYRVRPAVLVTNQALSLAPVSLLMVSNSPEKLQSEGLWFEGVLSSDEATRLLYHHVNATDASALLTVELWNLGTEPAKVHVEAGLAGPSYDEVWVGHRATSDYFRGASRGAGWVVSVPPGMVMTAFSQVMPRGAVVSGVAELRTLGAANVSVRVVLHSAGTPIGLRPVEYYQPSPLLGQWQYPQPLRQIQAKYEVGGNWAFITIGDQPAIGIKDGDRLLGSYGVIYEVQLQLVNPSNAPAQVAIMMEPAGGVARGSLLVDGRPAETAVMRTADEVPITSYVLAPGETRTVHIVTMPQAGSNYPVRLVARPI